MLSRRFGANRGRLVVLAAPAVLAIPSFLHAQALFTATPTGDWTVGTNWSTNPNPPGAGISAQINNGATATLGDGEIGQATALTIATGASTSGTLTLTSSATFIGTGVVNVGMAGGAGTLITSGSFTTSSTNIIIGNSGSTGTLIMSGGTISITSTGTDLFALGSVGSGTLLQSGGLISIPSTGTFGFGRNGTGYYDMEGGTMSVGGVLQMASSAGGRATLILNDGTISANQFSIAPAGIATCTMNGGTLLAPTSLVFCNMPTALATFTQTGVSYVGPASMDLGVGGSASYTQQAGMISVGTNMLIGGSGSSTVPGKGTFTQTGGSLSVGGSLVVGAGSLSIGTMNISGNGSIQVASTFSVGNAGSGTVNLCSLASGTTTLSAGTIQVGTVTSGTSEVDAQFLMGSTTDSGALPGVTVGTINFGLTNNSTATNRLFSVSSGTLTAGLVDLTSYNEPGGTSPNQAMFQQNGGTVSIGSMIFAGGVYQVGSATAAPTVVNAATLTVNGAGTVLLGSGSTASYSGGGTIACVGSLTLPGALTNNGAVLNVGALTNGTGTVSFRGAQTNAVGSGITVNSGQVNLQTNGGPNLTFTVSNAGKAVIGGGTFINQAEDIGTLSILGGGVARLFTNGPAATPTILLHAGTLSIHGDAVPTGTLDLAADDAIVDNGVFATIQAQVKSGYSGGTWSGPGIRSSTAAGQTPGLAGIGYATLGEIGNPSTFDGQTLSVLAPNATSSSVVLKYTLLGDANLDGTVNALDFNALATNFGSGGKDWSQGDFNYSSDGSIDSNDFALLAANYNKSVAGLSAAAIPEGAPAAALGTLVPEPASLGMLLACGVGMMSRRRRV